ncbi:MAG: hypothetical protein NT166_13425 [Candidatus Aminicenantes bacterium]|nr:hypothetical protein [Candidatus Aminicenantes bacterium]
MNPRYKIYIIIASILLHILFLLLWEGAVRLKLFDVAIPTPAVSPAQKENEPLVFDLQQQPDLPREVIETPADAKTVDKQTKGNFLSDKNALARNPETDPNLKEGEPFARGDLDVHELPQNQGPQGQPLPPVQQVQPREQQKEMNQPKAEPDSQVKETTPDTDGITHTGDLVSQHLQKQQQEMRPGVQEQLPSVKYDNQQSRALDMGGLSFNTYNWNFAPYMLELKRRVQRNIHPPPAFRELGLISGETLLRFKIYPNGMLKDLEILGYTGHKSLMVTSSNAIEVSAPFLPLPRDFPEDYLEVTGKFIYFVQK